MAQPRGVERLPYRGSCEREHSGLMCPSGICHTRPAIAGSSVVSVWTPLSALKVLALDLKEHIFAGLGIFCRLVSAYACYASKHLGFFHARCILIVLWQGLCDSLSCTSASPFGIARGARSVFAATAESRLGTTSATRGCSGLRDSHEEL